MIRDSAYTYPPGSREGNDLLKIRKSGLEMDMKWYMYVILILVKFMLHACAM